MNNGKMRIVQFIAAIVGTVLISLLGAWFTFGQAQSEQLVRLEQSEAEDARSRQVDQALVKAIQGADTALSARVSQLETRVTVLEAQIEQLLTQQSASPSP